MGQAFDREGRVLGEATGETKREVFDKLISEFKDAHEIRIQTLENRQAGQPMPRETAPQEPILQFFAWAHLPPRLGDVSRSFCELAEAVVATLPRNPERTVALRKLLEAKDAAVRAALYQG